MYRISISIWMPHGTGGLAIIGVAHRGDGKRFVVRADEKLTAFVELEAAIRASQRFAASGGVAGRRMLTLMFFLHFAQCQRTVIETHELKGDFANV